MNILLTGGAGYIGSHAAVELLEAGHTIIVIDNLSNSSAASLERVKQITGKDIIFYKGDVRDRALLDKILTTHTIDGIIHFAGLKAVGESVEKPLEYYSNNIDSTLVLLDAMRTHGVNRLVFSSSATVYGTPESLPLTEQSRIGVGITNPYGWTKFMNEQIITDFAASQTSFEATVLRYFNPVGAHASGLIGEDPNDIPNNLFPYISQTAVGKRQSVSVFCDDYDTPDGTGVRDYIHVSSTSLAATWRPSLTAHPASLSTTSAPAKAPRCSRPSLHSQRPAATTFRTKSCPAVPATSPPAMPALISPLATSTGTLPSPSPTPAGTLGNGNHRILRDIVNHTI